MYTLRRIQFNPNFLPKRQTWHNLSAFTQTNNDLNTWKELRTREAYVQGILDKESKRQIGDEIDWIKWQSSITHSNIVGCLKGFYENQMQLVSSLALENHKQFIKNHTIGWELYEDAIVSCKKSVEYSEGLVSNGARALWVSYNNPPLWKIDTNEWVESDLYWQAYIEKHHFYNPNPSSNDPELSHEIENSKKTWHTKVGAFNDRSYTSILYCYMEHLPSWEYYDIHRRAFLEHMSYYLIISGGSYKFFPEIPPWQWLTEIEKYRFQFISLVHRRRAQIQLNNLERERPLDLQPSDYEHDGEDFHTKFIHSEARSYELMIARIMGNFLFLTHPFIPFQTYSGYQNALNSDGGKGTVFSIGEDINALYYLPLNYSISVPSPKKSLSILLDHLTLTGRKFTPAYAGLLDIFTDILSKRPAEWFNGNDETLADAFIRRLSPEESMYSVFTNYIDEMKSKFANAQELVDPKAIDQKIEKMEDLLKKENSFYEQLIYILNSDYADEYHQQKELFSNLFNSDQLQPLFVSGSLIDKTDVAKEVSHSANSLIQDMSHIEENQNHIIEFMKAIKLGGLEKSLSK